MKETSKRRPRVQVAVWCLLSLLTFGIATSPAQQTGQAGTEALRSNFLESRASASSNALQGTVAFEGVVDRNAYHVGPGDRLILQIWSPSYEEMPAVVTGEGRVAVPFAGAVDVSGLTLAEAESAIGKEFESALKRGKVSVSLLEPRKFRVHVTGEVAVAGTYVLSATSRVADAVDMAGGVKSRLELQAGDSTIVPQASLRRVEMRNSRTSAVTQVDLLKFYQSGDLNGNPYLQDGAVIYVPPKEISNQVGVFGAVHKPGLYEFVPGDDIGSLFSLAGGLTDLADLEQVQHQKADGSTNKIDLSPSSMAMPLMANDRIYVGGKPRDLTHGSVTLRGQIKNPGGYSIEPGKTTVAEVLERAGGLLPNAAAVSARLVRNADERLENERRRVQYTPLKTSSNSDPQMLADMEMSAEFSRWNYGTVVLNLAASKGESGWSDSVVLQDGDVLDIPAQPLGVRVLGYVNNSGELPWVEGKDLSYYLEKAGGKNRAGWQGRAVILKARNGSQLRYMHNVSIDPGDVLFIPQRPRTTGWERVKDIITVVAQVATIVLVVNSVNK